MSFLQPRGRHRAPNKLASSVNSTARVSAAVAVGGGLVASAVFSQSAQAAVAPAQVAVTPAQSSLTVVQFTGRHFAEVVSAPVAAPRIRDAVAAETQLSAIVARTYVAPKPAPAPMTSRSATRPPVAPAGAASTRVGSTQNGGGQGSSTTPVTPPVSTPPVSTPVTNVPAATGGVIAIAERYLGVPYVWGGTTPSGFDCSGFTSYVFRQVGINLPRTAAAQQSALTPVSNPQPGDLVFFGSPAYHVGIYLGNGMEIAAPKPGDHVKIQPIYGTPSGYARP